MNIYFAVLKEGVSITKVSRKLSDAGMKMLKYYPKLGIVKFETEKKTTEIDFNFFLSIEEEKEDFVL